VIVFLTGPTGSGKTDTAWALVSAPDDIVFLDCDWFASRSRFSWKNPVDVESVYRALCNQIQFHVDEGRRRFVVTLTLEMAVSFQIHGSDFAELGLPMFAFRLFTRREINDKRVMDRGRTQRAQEAANAILQQTEFERLFPDDTMFQRIDTSDVAADAVANLILQRIDR
jgi:hypothetical protein